MLRRCRKLLIALTALTLTGAGCVEHKLNVTSDPPGALVTLNNQEVGRTPFTRDFMWYGNYDIQLRREGNETLKTHRHMTAPWWQWVPFDLAVDVLPFRFKDERTMHFTLHPATEESQDPGVVLDRAIDLRSQLSGSENTRPPTTRPTTKPAKSKSSP